MQLNEKKTDKKLLLLAIAFSLIAAFSVGITYYWRVVYEPPFAPIPFMLCTFLAVSVFCGITCFISRLCQKRENLQVVMLIAFLGIVFAFVLPPLQAPDETAHFIRSFAISHGHFDFDMQRQYSDELGALYQAFPMAFYNDYNQSIFPQFDEYFRLSAGHAQSYVGETLYLMVWPYLPQALGIFLARIFGVGALGQLYAARIFNVLVYAALCYPALKNCTRYRSILQAMMLLPISLQIVAGNSYDSWLFGSMLITFSYLGKEEITKRDLPLMLLFLLPCGIKPPQALTALVWVLIPAERWKIKTKNGGDLKKWQIFSIAAAGIVACCILYETVSALARLRMYNWGDLDRWNPDVETGGQIAFMLKNPLRTMAVFFFTLYEQEFFLKGLGEFCNLDISIPMVVYLSMFMLIIAAFFDGGDQKPGGKKTAVVLVLFGMVYSGVIMAALYVTWTPVGMIRVLGLQTRYFLPAAFAFCIAGSCVFGHLVKLNEINRRNAQKIKLWLPYWSTAISALLLFQHCFIGPFAH